MKIWTFHLYVLYFYFYFIFIFYFSVDACVCASFEAFAFSFLRGRFGFLHHFNLVLDPTMAGERRDLGENQKVKRRKKSRNQYVAHVFSRLHHKNERKSIRFIFYPIPSRFSLSANVFNWIYYCCCCCCCFCCFPNQIAHRCILSGLTFTQNTENQTST